MGSGEIEDPQFRLTFGPLSRLSHAVDNLELARQTVANCSFYIMTSNFKELMVRKGLVLYEKDELTNLLAVINEKAGELAGAHV
jgi:hypothetical protein